MTTTDGRNTDGQRSRVMHETARHYDLLAGLLTLGREGALRERLVDLAQISSGERVLDVGCGTGSLALAARRRVGAAGMVSGIDASPEMVALAQAKATREGLDVEFREGRAEALPFADASFDVVLGTLMLHHLPPIVRRAFAREVRRVLRPGGRALAVDFEKPAGKQSGIVARIHRHGGVPIEQIVALLGGAGLRVVDRGRVGLADLQFVLAMTCDTSKLAAADVNGAVPLRSLPRLPMPPWVLLAVIPLIVLAHLLVVRLAWSAFTLGALAGIGGLVFVLAHLAAAGGVFALRRGDRRR